MLVDKLPEAVSVDGKKYCIYSDFRTGVLFEQLILDREIENSDKVYAALSLYFKEKPPENIQGAFLAILEFYRLGADIKPAPQTKNRKSMQKQIYDFEFDAPYIYAAFLSQYRIDLCETEYLHWWKFMALFNALDENCEMRKIMSYRATDTSKIKSQQERARINRLKAIHALPVNMSTQDKISIAGSIFGGGIR